MSGRGNARAPKIGSSREPRLSDGAMAYKEAMKVMYGARIPANWKRYGG